MILSRWVLIVGLFSFSLQAYAGVGGWILDKASDVGTSYMGAKMAGAGNGTCNQNQTTILNNVAIANAHLWNMHLVKNYTKNYKFYLNFLEKNAKSYRYWDTVAVVYLENNKAKKALKIYEEKVMPWLVGADKADVPVYQSKYETIKKAANCIFCRNKEFDRRIDTKGFLEDKKKREEFLKKENIRKEKEEARKEKEKQSLLEKTKRKMLGIAEKINKKFDEKLGN